MKKVIWKTLVNGGLPQLMGLARPTKKRALSRIAVHNLAPGAATD